MAGSGQSKEEVQEVLDGQAQKHRWEMQELRDASEAKMEQMKAEMRRERVEQEDRKDALDTKFLALQQELAAARQVMSDDRAREAEKRLQSEMERNREMARMQAEQFERQREDTAQTIALMRESLSHQSAQMTEMQRRHAEDMAAYMKENASAMSQFAETIKALKSENDSFVFDPSQPDKYNEQEQANFAKFCVAAAKALGDVPKLKKLSIAVLGPAGVGKSALINSFAGKKVTKTDITECTDSISMVYGEGRYDFYDVPGSHDARCDFFKVQNLMKLKAVHLVLIVYTDRIDHCAKCARLCKSIGLPFIVVRNKCDFANKEAGNNWDEAMEKEKVKINEYTQVADLPIVYLGYVSQGDPGVTHKPENFDVLSTLVDTMLLAK